VTGADLHGARAAKAVFGGEANDPNGAHDFLKFELSNRSFIFSIVV
jgi:hypothetical protein